MEIRPESTVYCDIPYRGTSEYVHGNFNHAEFYDWVRSRPFPVYISEYAMPDDFVAVWSREKICAYSRKKTKKTIEKIFIHRKWAEKYQPIGQPDLFMAVNA